MRGAVPRQKLSTNHVGRGDPTRWSPSTDRLACLDAAIPARLHGSWTRGHLRPRATPSAAPTPPGGSTPRLGPRGRYRRTTPSRCGAAPRSPLVRVPSWGRATARPTACAIALDWHRPAPGSVAYASGTSSHVPEASHPGDWEPLGASQRVVIRALRLGPDVTAAKRFHGPLCLRLTASGGQQPWHDPWPACECPGNDLRPRGPAWYRPSPTLPQPYPARAPGL